MNNNTESTPDIEPVGGATADAENSRSFRDRIAEMPEKRRSFLAGLAVGAAVLGGAWGVTGAFGDGNDHDHRGGDKTEMSDHRDMRGPEMTGQMDGHRGGEGR